MSDSITATPRKTTLSVHPPAELFQAPITEDYERLKEDIRNHGQRVPIVLTSDGRILDGVSRARACQELEITPITRPATAVEETDPYAFVLSMNLARRQLNESLRAMVAEKLAALKDAVVKTPYGFTVLDGRLRAIVRQQLGQRTVPAFLLDLIEDERAAFRYSGTKNHHTRPTELAR